MFRYRLTVESVINNNKNQKSSSLNVTRLFSGTTSQTLSDSLKELIDLR